MAYRGAQFRGSGVRVGTEIQNFTLWKRYVGPTWAGLIQILDEVPIEDLGAPEARLRQAAARVASQWVTGVAAPDRLRYVVGPWGEAFYVDRHDFPSGRIWERGASESAQTTDSLTRPRR